MSLLHFRGRTYGGIGDPSTWHEPGGTPVAAPPYVADEPIGTTFSRWQSGGQFPAGSELYSVASEPIERMVALKVAGRTWFFRHYPDDRSYGLDTVQVVLGTVTSFGPGCWTTPGGKPPARAAGDGVFYTPATIAVERVLHGRIPAGAREIEVRQLGGVTGESPRPGVLSTADSPAVPLAPGSRVILFVQPGQWSRGAPGEMPAGDYYVLGPYPAERSYLVEDGQVTPLGGRNGGAEQLPLAAFLAGLVETLQGVRPLDPHGPRPTPIPLPTVTPVPPSSPPTPTPRVRAGQSVNLVALYQLEQAQALALRGPAASASRAVITDGASLGAIVAALDRMLPVSEDQPDRPADPHGVVVLAFTFAGRDYIGLEYDRIAGTLTSRADPYNPFSVPAPPDFAQLLGLQ